MWMTDSQICLSYKQADDKFKQISILAQLNASNIEEILLVLLKNGINVPKYIIDNSRLTDYEIIKAHEIYKENKKKQEEKINYYKNIDDTIDSDIVKEESIKVKITDDIENTINNKGETKMARRKKVNINKEDLEKLYIIDGLSAKESAKQLNISIAQLFREAKRFGLKKNNRNKSVAYRVKKETKVDIDKNYIKILDKRIESNYKQIEKLQTDNKRLMSLKDKYINTCRELESALNNE